MVQFRSFISSAVKEPVSRAPSRSVAFWLCSQISGVAPSLQHRWNSDRLARTAMDLAVSGRLRLVELISHTMPIGQAPEAFQLLDEHPEQVMQVVLSFAHDGQQVAA